MAEGDLGIAKLVVVADTDAATDSLRKLRSDIESLSNQQRQLAQQTRSIGRREGSDALDVQQRSLNRITTLTNQLNALEARGNDVASQRLRLAEALDLVNQGQFRSARLVTEELRNQLLVERQLQQEQARSSSRGARLGGAREGVDTRERARQRRFDLNLQINRLEDLGVSTSALRSGQGGLGTLTQAIADRQFGTADQLANELSRRIRLAFQKARRDIDSNYESLRIGKDNAVPISGRTRSGFVYEGSPAFQQEATAAQEKLTGRATEVRLSWQRAFAVLQETAESIIAGKATGAINLRSSWSNFLQQVEEIKTDIATIASGKQINLRSSWTQALNQLQETKVDIDSITKTKQINLRASWSEFLKQLGQIKADIDSAKADAVLNRERSAANFRAATGKSANPVTGLMPDGFAIPGSPAGRAWTEEQIRKRNERERLRDLASGAFNAVPIDGRLGKDRFIPGSPAAREALRERLTRAGGDALIGGAFPLLFGQGVGASAGGLLGGAAGGAMGGMFGFGLSLVGTAIGGAVDTLQKRFTDLAGALQDPIKNVETLTQQFVLASKSQEDYVKALIATGQTARAAQVIQEQAARTLDPTLAATTAAANDGFNRTLAETQNILGAIVGGPATQFLNFLNGVLRSANNAPTEASAAVFGPEAVARSENNLRASRPSAGGLLAQRLGLDPGGAARRLAAVQAADTTLRIAYNPEGLKAQGQLDSAVGRQRQIQEEINKARLAGNKPLADALGSIDRLNAAATEYRQRNVQIEAAAASSAISQQQAESDRLSSLRTFQTQQAAIVVESKNNQRITAQQLSDDRRRVEAQREILALTGSSSFAGKTGLVRADASDQILQQRLQLEAANRNQSTAQQAFDTASKNPANKAALDAAKADLATANNTAESARIKTALEIRKIEVATQVELRRLERERASEQLASVLRIADLRRQTTLERQRLNTDPLEFQRREALQPLQRANDAVRQARSDLNLDPQNEGLQRRLNEAINAQRLAFAASSNRVADINEQIRQRGQRFGLDLAGLRDQQAIERARPQLGPLGLQTLQGAAQLRDAQRQTEAARQDAAARPADVDRQQNFVRASERLELASINFRNNLKEAFDDAVKRAGDVQRNLNLNVASLAEQDNSPANSINKFLRQAYGDQAIQERQQSAFKELLPRFIASRQRLAESERKRGNDNTAAQIEGLNFRGSTEGVNQSMIEFIRSTENQTQLQEEIAKGQKDLVKANNDLAVVVKALEGGGKLQATLDGLTKATDSLAAKDWNVYVQAPLPGKNP